MLHMWRRHLLAAIASVKDFGATSELKEAPDSFAPGDGSALSFKKSPSSCS
jgi:hypothetical protein